MMKMKKSQLVILKMTKKIGMHNPTTVSMWVGVEKGKTPTFNRKEVSQRTRSMTLTLITLTKITTNNPPLKNKHQRSRKKKSRRTPP